MNTALVADAPSAEVVTAKVAAIGQHVLADLYGIAPALLRDAPALAAVLRSAAEAAGAHLLASHFHSFGTDDGVTGVVLLAESHISIHTWPEFGFAAADIFMCGNTEPARALAVLVTALAPLRQEVRTAARGARPGC
jgi:S-adenosylmethionine decarboxylase